MADCGLSNLASCLPDAFFQYVLSLISSPLQPLLDLVKLLLTTPVDLNLYLPLWVIVIYVLSMFYSFLIMYSGFTFLISGYDAAKRENAKQWLRNTVIMIVLVQASFFIYQSLSDVSSAIASSTLTLVPQDFFSLTIDNIPDLTQQFLFGMFYLSTLLLTLFFLTLRYAIVAVGVMFFPLAIFFYFIQPLKSYGLLALNFLLTSVFITGLDAIILAGFGKLIQIDLFSNLKIIVMITAFSLINLVTFFLMYFSIVKSGVNTTMNAIKIGGTIAKFI